MTANPVPLKQYLQRSLDSVGAYHRLKASRVYDLYWSIADRRVIDDRRREIGFSGISCSGSAREI